MRLVKSVICGLAAALLGAGAVQAGTLDILYWGKDGSATVVVDGQTYDLNAADDWVTIKNIDSGSHSLTLYANGASMSRDFTLSYDNADTTTGENAPSWCMDLEDNGADLLDLDTCDDMMGAYFGE